MNRSSEGVAPDSILRTISGFYPTPATVVGMMLRELGPLTSNDRVLEPSAGKGDIADRLVAVGVRPAVIEPHPVLAAVLRSKGYEPFEGKFEDFAPRDPFDRIIMNPPFADTLDMIHVRRAFDLLDVGGILVSLITDGEDDATPDERAAFARWLMEDSQIQVARMERLERALFLGADAFKPSGIPKRLLTLRKKLSPGAS